jgi:hemerythrin-like domain-containing protein
MAQAIITAINEEHRTIARLLHLIDKQVALFSDAEAPDLELLHLIMDYTRAYPDLYHHPKENAIFITLRDRDPAIAPAVEALLDEHATMSNVTDRFATMIEQLIGDATMPRDAFVKAAMEYVDFQRSHMRREVEVVLPAAIRLLNEQDWADIAARIDSQPDPLAGGQERYRKLSDLLLTEV